MSAGACPSGTGLSPTVEPASGLAGSAASIPSAIVTELPGEYVTWFRIRAGWEWASIFVRPIDDGAEVVVHSSFGTFGYTWISMGGDWREFLCSCSREYAMRKLAGTAYEVPLDREEFISLMRAEVDAYERNVADAWGILDADQEGRIQRCRDALEDPWSWEDVPLEALFWHFNEQAGGAPYVMELYEARLTKVSPQVVGFWDTIWAPFTGYLASAIEARRAETAGLGAQHESATGEAGDAQIPASRNPNP